MCKAIQSDKCLVYKFYNAQDELLYIGVAIDWMQRRKQHKRKSWWFAEVSREEFEFFDDWRAAGMRELALIFDQSPRYNFVGTMVGGEYHPPRYGVPIWNAGTHEIPSFPAKHIRRSRTVAIVCGCLGVFCHLHCVEHGSVCLRSSLTETNALEVYRPGADPFSVEDWLLTEAEKWHLAEKRRANEERRIKQIAEKRRRAAERRASPAGRKRSIAAAAKGMETICEKGRQAAREGLPRNSPYGTKSRLWLEGYDEIVERQQIQQLKPPICSLNDAG